MEKKTIIKWILGSIGVSLILVVLTILVMTRSIGMRSWIGWPVLVLFGIEVIRQKMMDKYHISFRKWFLLTFLPPILAYGVYVCFYIFMDNNYWAELEGLLGYIILLAWGGCIGVSVLGTLIIALIRRLIAVVIGQRDKKVE